MRLRFAHISAAVMLALPGAVGCAPNHDGIRILESLRRDGLLADDSNEPVLRMDAAPRANPVMAALPADGTLTLAALLDAADRLNPRIAAARASIGIAAGEAWQASLYPNPAVELESENVRPSDGGFGGSETTVGVAQPIIIGGRREASVAAGDAQMSVKRWELERVRREVHGRIRRTVTEIASAQRAIALYGELLDLARRTLDIAAARFEARAAPESEAIRARVEFNSLEIAVERLRGEIAASSERLDALLGGHHVDVDRITPESVDEMLVTALPELAQLQNVVRASHPALEAAASEIDAAERRVELERAKRVPDLTARLGVGVNHADDEGFVEGGVGLPLPIFDQNQGNVLAARFGVLRARAEADAVSTEILADLAEAYRRWESAVARLSVYEEQILGGAQRSYEQTFAGYEAGALPFLDLLDAQRTLAEANVARVELVRSVSLALSDILEILGEQPQLEDTQGD